ncbi:MAG: malonyl-ACP O-methyltransferase BioC [Carboxylicivirga sp.]|jgi:malonyl-ACP O-methyltransferase BioC|nr:malonyl-ACP O-methyltransferase BioC [Carboxylicivirga sp.]
MTELNIAVRKQEVNKCLLKKRFRSAQSTYNAHAKVQQDMAVRLANLAQAHVPASQKKLLEFGCGTGLLTNEIMKCFEVDTYTYNDLVDDADQSILPLIDAQVQQTRFIAGDVEQIEFPAGQDSIWSGATIQWIDHLGNFFQKLHSALNEGGYLVLSSFGPDNYQEIKCLTGNGITYKTKEQIRELAAPYFELVAFEEWQHNMWFKSPMEVLKHMRYTGVNSVSHCRWSKGQMQAFMADYDQFLQLEGYPLTYHPYLMIFKKK